MEATYYTYNYMRKISTKWLPCWFALWVCGPLSDLHAELVKIPLTCRPGVENMCDNQRWSHETGTGEWSAGSGRRYEPLFLGWSEKSASLELSAYYKIVSAAIHTVATLYHLGWTSASHLLWRFQEPLFGHIPSRLCYTHCLDASSDFVAMSYSLPDSVELPEPDNSAYFWAMFDMTRL